MRVSFVVPGPPIPKARARVYTDADGRGRAVTPKRTKAYEKHVGIHALAARQALRERWPLDAAAYAVDLRVLEPPKALGDLDNYLKAIVDGCQGVLFADDRRVRRAHVEVVIDAEWPRIEMAVEVLL